MDGPKLSGSRAGSGERWGNTVVADNFVTFELSEVLGTWLDDPVASSCNSLALRSFMNPTSPKSKLLSLLVGAAALNFQEGSVLDFSRGSGD